LLDRLQQERYRAWASVSAGEVMSSDYEKRLEALYKQASNEKDPEKLKQLISEILAVLEANQKHLRARGVEPSDDEAS
jgi:phenylacetate-coenzyme A ligase PaaK-like adenylate-forming protein